MGRPRKINPSPEMIEGEYPSPEIDEQAITEVIKNKIKDTGPALNLSARPARKAESKEIKDLPVIAVKVFGLVVIGPSGRGRIDFVPLHEIPLLRKKLSLQDGAAERPQILAEWPENKLSRTRDLTLPELRLEQERLFGRYTFQKPGGREGEECNLVLDLYGSSLSALRDVMNRIYRGYKQAIAMVGPDEILSDSQVEELVMLADPDFGMEIESPFSEPTKFHSYEP